MKKTKIQWCHSTVNPVMGCDGCELWPGKDRIVAEMLKTMHPATGVPADVLRSTVRRVVGDREASEIFADREGLAEQTQASFRLPDCQRQTLVDVIRVLAKCYAR